MKRLKLYIETSVWNFLFEEDAPEKKYITGRFFHEIETGNYEIFVSEAVNAEVLDAPADRRQKLLDAFQKYNPAVLYGNKEVDSLAEAYIGNNLLTRKHFRDILHLAFASSNEIDILISWNMRHLVRKKTQVLVNIINKIQGYQNLEIWTPEELVDYEE